MKTDIAAIQTRRAIAAGLALWLVTGCSAGVETPANAFVPLIGNMAERLGTADQVALSKWDSGQPVYDPQREAQVIENAVRVAPGYGLSAEDATNIFVDQIEASKEVQYALLDDWKRQGSAPATPRQSLSGVIRPALDKMQISIMQNLRAVAPLRSTENCRTQVALAVDQVVRQMSIDVLHFVALDSAVARVCLKS
ncbi:chorismate mutase [Paraburkholderia agricolaris]|uniref:chorismate mutase n=1 Tax=Paraburkholderia agricolaris TaxID=2152888 RepID=UPI0038B966E1